MDALIRRDLEALVCRLDADASSCRTIINVETQRLRRVEMQVNALRAELAAAKDRDAEVKPVGEVDGMCLKAVSGGIVIRTPGSHGQTFVPISDIMSLSAAVSDCDAGLSAACPPITPKDPTP